MGYQEFQREDLYKDNLFQPQGWWEDGQIDLTDFKKTPPIPANGKPSGQCEIGPLGAGHYIFKIRSVDENGGKSKFSERAFFQIK